MIDKKMCGAMACAVEAAEGIAVEELIRFGRSSASTPPPTFAQALNQLFEVASCNSSNMERRYWYQKMTVQKLLISCINGTTAQQLRKTEAAAMQVVEQNQHTHPGVSRR